MQMSGNSEDISTSKKKKIHVPEICPYCPKMLSRRDKLVQHIKTQHPGAVIPHPPGKKIEHQCETRKVDFECENSLDEAEAEHSKEVAKVEVKENVLKHLPLPCPWPFCGKILSRRDKLNHHIKHVHMKNKDEEKSTKENVIEGLKNSTKDKSENPVEETENQTEKHLNSEKSPPSKQTPKKKPQPPPCPFCKSRLSRMDKLRKHIERKHPGEKFELPKLKKLPGNGKKATKKVKKGKENKAIKLVTPWELLWNSKEPVFVKFDFNKRPSKRARTESELTVELNC